MSKRFIFLVLLVLVAVAGGAWWWHLQGRESTDNAYVKADILPVMSRINGTVSKILVADNAQITKGQPLLQLDASDAKVAVSKATAELTKAQAVLAHLVDREQAQQALVSAAKASSKAAAAELQRAEQQYQRLAKLSSKQYVSKDDLDAAQLARDAAQARLAQAQAQHASQQAQLAVIEGEKPQLQAQVAAAQASVEQAKLNLSYTTLYASRAGEMTSRQVQLGQSVAPGARLMSLVTKPLWIDANFKETQVAKMAVGQAVNITADTLPGKVFKGHVQSFAGATGSEFALLPPQNATGNFTKVVQRLPVRIAFDQGQDLQPLRPGMSVVVTVFTE